MEPWKQTGSEEDGTGHWTSLQLWRVVPRGAQEPGPGPLRPPSLGHPRPLWCVVYHGYGCTTWSSVSTGYGQRVDTGSLRLSVSTTDRGRKVCTRIIKNTCPLSRLTFGTPLLLNPLYQDYSNRLRRTSVVSLGDTGETKKRKLISTKGHFGTFAPLPTLTPNSSP